jgi:hypothetical protein
MKKMSCEQLAREAALLAFCDPLPQKCSLLRRLSVQEWRQLLRWLDVHGLTLYLLDRLAELRLTRIMPPDILARLNENLADNTARMRSLLAETISIHREFERAGLSYALLKGFSLWPDSVPRPELRSQLDLDFLVSEQDIQQAKSILERRGYHLRAVSGQSWEFKTDHIPSGSLDDLYKSVPHRSIDLHTGADANIAKLLLASAETRTLDGAGIPVVSPSDLFLGQSLHLFKHVASEFFRAAHLSEFRRHVLARRDDLAFWAEVRSKVEQEPRACIGLGVITLLTTHLIGEFAPAEFTEWTVGRLPANVRLWVEEYGHRITLRGSPDKYYLLLQKELEAVGSPAKRSLRRALLPLKLPPVVARATANETPHTRMLRYRFQARFILIRLRFHCVEGVRYAWESTRWRRLVNRLKRDGVHAPAFKQIQGQPRSALPGTTIE